MKINFRNVKIYLWEFLLQLILLALVFAFYSFDQENHQVKKSEVVLFLNYTIASYFISYFLLPKFLYKKKYLLFFLLLAIIIGLVIYIEEGVIEQIYYPDTRGKRFPGVLYNLVETLPIVCIITGFKFAWDALTKQGEVEQLKNTIQESELMYLKSQINPHFLFNNLNNLYSYSLENSPKTPEIILELSSVLRYILYEARGNYVPVSKEIEHLNNYIKLSKLHLEDRGEVSFSHIVESYDFKIAPLILPVFVENAFKHSSSSQTDNVFIKIELDITAEGNLTFICSNNFTDYTNTQNLSKGIGLENVKRRLELLYPKSHNLVVDVKEDLYLILLELQLQQI